MTAALLKPIQASVLDPERDDRKLFATLQAKLALWGHCVNQNGNGSFTVIKWGQSRHCPDIDALAAFYRQIGGKL